MHSTITDTSGTKSSRLLNALFKLAADAGESMTPKPATKMLAYLESLGCPNFANDIRPLMVTELSNEARS